jgi:tetratricopeptide (TPR) repeat protein
VKYRGFVSYSHSDSATVARLHRWLESYRLPGRLRTSDGAQRLSPIFRDRDELPTSADLGTQLTAALEASDRLLVFCSPAAARSRWVNEEVASFVRAGRREHVIVIFIDGDATHPQDPSTAETECLPPALARRPALAGPAGSHRCIDMRSGRSGQRFERLQIVSEMTGIGVETLQREDIRRGIRRTAGLVAVAICTTACLAFMGLWAFRAAAIARHEAAAADASRAQAVAAAERARTEAAIALLQERNAKESSDFFVSMFSAADTPVTAGNLLFADVLQKSLRRLLPSGSSEPEIRDAASRHRLLACLAVALSHVGLQKSANEASQAVASNAAMLDTSDVPAETIALHAAQTASAAGDYPTALARFEQARDTRLTKKLPMQTADFVIARGTAVAALKGGRPTAEVEAAVKSARSILDGLEAQSRDYCTVELLQVESMVAQERRGDRREAESLLRKALGICEKAQFKEAEQFGTGVTVNIVLNNPAVPDAVSLMEKAVAFYEKTLGPNQLETNRAQLTLGQALQYHRRLDEALEHLHRCVAWGRNTADEHPVFFRDALVLTVAVYCQAGRETDARPLAQEILDQLQRAPAADDRSANALEVVARTLINTNEAKNARVAAAKALAIREQLHGSESPVLLNVLFTLAQIDASTGNVAAAIESLSRLLAMLPEDGGDFPVKAVEAHTLLTYAHASRGDSKKSETHANEAVRLCELRRLDGATYACALIAKAKAALSGEEHVERLKTFAAALQAAGRDGSSLPGQTMALLQTAITRAGADAMLEIELGVTQAADSIVVAIDESLNVLKSQGSSGQQVARVAQLALAHKALEAAQPAVADDHDAARVLAQLATRWLDGLGSSGSLGEQEAAARAVLIEAQCDVLDGQPKRATDLLRSLQAPSRSFPREHALVLAVALIQANDEKGAREALGTCGLLNSEEWPQWTAVTLSTIQEKDSIQPLLERLHEISKEVQR